MSKEYMVLIVDVPDDASEAELEGTQARVWMRFTEQPRGDLLQGLAEENPGQRVYCLMGASTWWTSEPK